MQGSAHTQQEKGHNSDSSGNLCFYTGVTIMLILHENISITLIIFVKNNIQRLSNCHHDSYPIRMQHPPVGCTGKRASEPSTGPWALSSLAMTELGGARREHGDK